MSDLTLLTFGCAVTFIATAGAYVAIREQFLDGLGRRLAARSRSPRARVR